MTHTCKHCGNAFDGETRRTQEGAPVYCSRRCRLAGTKAQVHQSWQKVQRDSQTRRDVYRPHRPPKGE